MPIYQGLSTKNKAEIIINSQPMQKVYVGDRLVWQKPSGIFYPEYGLLYNWYAATDVRNIAAEGWHVPTLAEAMILGSYTGAIYDDEEGYYPTGSEKYKEVGCGEDYHWYCSPPIAHTNELGFNARGSGFRTNIGFEQIKQTAHFICEDGVDTYNILFYVEATTDYFYVAITFKCNGNSIRLVRPATSEELALLDGTYVDNYIGNDGKTYLAVKIGSQVWLACNLAETLYRDGSIIPWHGADPANYFTNAEWAALTTAGCCAYDNTLSNVAAGFTFPT